MIYDWFLILLLVAVIVRGLGAGIIVGAELMTLPVRHRLGLTRYAQFMRAHYKEHGVKAYAAITICGLVLLVILSVWTFARGDSMEVSGLIVASFLTTIFGLVGTAGAYPTMRKLWNTSDDHTETIAHLLDRFAYWGILSAVSHVVAFILVSIALAYL